ncbi:MAG: transposase [Bdellovibrionales bacterium]|nr:transposase [Bdellovibrionales bacterium]
MPRVGARFFKDLVRRGLNPQSVQIGIMDGLPGLETAFKESFVNAVTARCWVHSLKKCIGQNASKAQRCAQAPIPSDHVCPQ